MSKEFKIGVNDSGALQFVHSDELTDILAGLDGAMIAINRASNVEPLGRDWYASMTFGEKHVLGPFAHRQTALDAEVEYLQERIGSL